MIPVFSLRGSAPSFSPEFPPIPQSQLPIFPKGYYGLDSLLMLLAFMAMARLKSIESLRYCAPGEWGQLLGLDRVPEVRTLRAKIQCLAQDDHPEQWSAELCERWMATAPEQAGVLYIDGHVRVYNGSQTKLPRHYVARQRLCLRATTAILNMPQIVEEIGVTRC